MSDQFSELKTILHTSSHSTSCSRPIIREDPVECTSSNSDVSSTDSDFSFPVPAHTPATVSPHSNSFQLVVQDLSAEMSGKSPASEHQIGNTNFVTLFKMTFSDIFGIKYMLDDLIIFQITLMVVFH